MFLKTTGCCRFVWNYFLAKNIDYYKETGKFLWRMDLQKLLPEMKLEFPWLKEVDSQALQGIAKNLDQAFKRSFSKKSKKQAGFPRFKSKRENQHSFVLSHRTRINSKLIQVPKIGLVKYRSSRKLEGKIKSYTISLDVDQWYVSILCELSDQEIVINHSNSVGIDVGIKTFAITSDGEVFDLPKYKKENRQLKKLQQKHSKKSKDSKNKNKSKIKVARKYREIRRKKLDKINNMVASITKNYDVIITENLNIAGMKKNRCLSGAIQENPWAQFIGKLSQKSKGFHKIDRWFPSSKTCSNCGWIKKDLTLGDRTFNCDSCGYEIDRDLNAAINIQMEYYSKNTGIEPGIQACGDTAIGDLEKSGSRYVSLNQEFRSVDLRSVAIQPLII
jgi:putative transposase